MRRIRIFDTDGNRVSVITGGAGGFSYLSDIAVDAGGFVFAADRGNNRIQKFSAEGVFIKTFGSLGSLDGQMTDPKCISLGPDGNLYVFENNRISVFDKDGNFIRKWGTGLLNVAWSMDFAPDGLLYIAEYYTNKIKVFDIFGNSVAVFGTAGSGDGMIMDPYIHLIGGGLLVADRYNRVQKFVPCGTVPTITPTITPMQPIDVCRYNKGTFNFNFIYNPAGMTKDTFGNIYVSETDTKRVSVFSTSGNFIRSIGNNGTTEQMLKSPSLMASGPEPDSNLYVIDEHTVKYYSPDGIYKGMFGGYGTGDSQLNYPRGIAVSLSGKVFVSDAGNNVLKVFDAQGGFLNKIGSEGIFNGQFRRPGALTIGSDGLIYVLEQLGNRIQVFTESGSFVRLFQIPSGNCWDMKFGPGGFLYVSDESQNPSKVNIFTAYGHFINSFGENLNLLRPRIEFNGTNEILISNASTNKIGAFIPCLDVTPVVIDPIPNPPLLPDLIPVKVDASSLYGNWQDLTSEGVITAEIRNIGDNDASGNFYVTFFQDVNTNGLFDSLTDKVMGESVLSGIPSGGKGYVSIDYNGPVLFRECPVSVCVDSANSIDEDNEKNNIIHSGSRCNFLLPKTKFAMKQKWKSSSSIFDDRIASNIPPIVIDLENDGRTEIVTIGSFSINTTYGSTVLRVFDGRTGIEKNNNAVDYLSHVLQPAAADIDHDGKVEIIGVSLDMKNLIAFESNLSVKWKSDPFYPESYKGDMHKVAGHPAIADLNHDGNPEIICGNHVFDSNGKTVWAGDIADGSGLSADYNHHYSTVLAADLDNDGTPEIVDGRIVYKADGTILWKNLQLSEAVFTAVADFNDDGFQEIVMVDAVEYGRVWLIDHNGNSVWPAPFSDPDLRGGGAPTIGDFNGDGRPEIGVAFDYRYVILDGYGNRLWSKQIDDNSKTTGSTSFDFDGDGTDEILYQDSSDLWIFDGVTGLTLIKHGMGSGTANNYPVVADIDNDGHAEIVAPASNSGDDGIHAFEGITDNWSKTGKVWNQFSYHITNIMENGRVPAKETDNFNIFNNYRVNEPMYGCKNIASDLTSSYVRLAQNGSNRSITARIGNAGSDKAPAGINISYYNGNPKEGGVLIGTAVTSAALVPGAYEDVVFKTAENAIISGPIWISADDNGTFSGVVDEMSELNNIHNSGIYPDVMATPTPIPTLMPRPTSTPSDRVLKAELMITSVDASSISFNPQTLQASGQVKAIVFNRGDTGAKETFRVVFFRDVNGDKLYEADTDETYGSAPVYGLAAAGSKTASVTINAQLPFAGSLIYAKADYLNRVIEYDEDNNINDTGNKCGFNLPGINMQMQEKWAWTQSSIEPDLTDIAASPLTADLDKDGCPEVIVVTGNVTQKENAIIRILDGKTGAERLAVSNSVHRVYWMFEPAAADIDGDGYFEIVATAGSGDKLIALEHDGSFKWFSDPIGGGITGRVAGRPSIADLDADGVPEIVVGNHCFNSDGSTRWAGDINYGTGSNNTFGSASLIADIDNDKSPEIVAGMTVYDKNGAVVWGGYGIHSQGYTHTDGLPAMINFNIPVLDAFGEIAVAAHSDIPANAPVMHVQCSFGNLLLSYPFHGWTAMGAPVIADFNGDGHADIGLSVKNKFRVFEPKNYALHNNLLSWEAPLNDIGTGPGVDGATAFDLNADGKDDIIVHDRQYLRLLNGGNGAEFSKVALSSPDTLGYPVISDID
ncbi:MAG TPA: FG-GAP-like repeat-containing protein, partial [Candidatus Goldiibacteriota bacterium]|nr:FG-GAP-like repeat-containing protein [Candidatus Goldiibacteriota bacterium]